MKLISLKSDLPSFKPVCFNPKGLSIILGSKGSSDHGGSNGSGKTLALKLVHLCLGSQSAPDVVRRQLPEQRFILEFEVNGCRHAVSRRGDGTEILLDGEPQTVAAYRMWLNKQNVFIRPKNSTDITFRGMIHRFARQDKREWTDPVAANEEKSYVSFLKTLYFLGVPSNLIQETISRKQRIDTLDKGKKALEDTIKEQISSRETVSSQAHIERLRLEISTLENHLKNYSVAEDYKSQETRSNDLTLSLRKFSLRSAQIMYEIKAINDSLDEKPDISHEELLKLYSGLRQVFVPEALEHFKAVEKFHQDMIRRRKERLSSDLASLEVEQKSIEQKQNEALAEKQSILQYLSDKKAFDEYNSMHQRLTSKKERLATLTAWEQQTKEIQGQIALLNKEQAVCNLEAQKYVTTEPLARYSQLYAQLTSKMYPDKAAALTLRSNTNKKNHKLFNFEVELQGSDSEGIGACRIICLDWLIFLYGQNHMMDFLWHDGALFADSDPAPRARWLSYTLNALATLEKQYIISMTNENFASMKEYLTAKEWDTLTRAVILTLGNENEKDLLLGMTVSM